MDRLWRGGQAAIERVALRAGASPKTRARIRSIASADGPSFTRRWAGARVVASQRLVEASSMSEILALVLMVLAFTVSESAAGRESLTMPAPGILGG